MRISVAILWIFVWIGCSGDSRDPKKEREDENQRLLYIALTTSTDVSGNCIQSEDAALACAASSGATATYIGTIQSVYTMSTAATTSNTICSEMPGSKLFQGFTSTAKICHFTCNKQYFTNMAAQGKCTSGNYTAVLTAYTTCLPVVWFLGCTDTSFASCLNTCFRQGTVVP